MYAFAKDCPLDVEAFRVRLRKMSDAELLKTGKAAKFMCSPAAYFGNGPRETFVIQLREVSRRIQAPKSRQAHFVLPLSFSCTDG
jgi:hypothetical protein